MHHFLIRAQRIVGIKDLNVLRTNAGEKMSGDRWERLLIEIVLPWCIGERWPWCSAQPKPTLHLLLTLLETLRSCAVASCSLHTALARNEDVGRRLMRCAFPENVAAFRNWKLCNGDGWWHACYALARARSRLERSAYDNDSKLYRITENADNVELEFEQREGLLLVLEYSLATGSPHVFEMLASSGALGVEKRRKRLFLWAAHDTTGSKMQRLLAVPNDRWRLFEPPECELLPDFTTELQAACAFCDNLAALERLLRAAPNAHHPLQPEVFDHACSAGSLELVHFLMRRPEIDPSLCNNRALNLAVTEDRVDIVRVLLSDWRVLRSLSERGHNYRTLKFSRSQTLVRSYMSLLSPPSISDPEWPQDL